MYFCQLAVAHGENNNKSCTAEIAQPTTHIPQPTMTSEGESSSPDLSCSHYRLTIQGA